jgi:hypothetical protein
MPTVLPRRPPDPAADRLSAVEPLADGLARLLDDLHEQLAGDQLRALARLDLQPSELLALGRVGEPGVHADAAMGRRLAARGLAQPGGRGGAWLLTAAGRAVLDELHDARASAIRRFVAGLDRARRLRLAGALHLLSDELEGGAVVGA